jgi:predicted DNA-binding antitoxin AbrB/MazE fold protein
MVENVVEAVYKKGDLKLVGMPKIEGNFIKIRVINRDDILTQGDIDDILDTLKEKSEGKLASFNEVFSQKADISKQTSREFFK